MFCMNIMHILRLGVLSFYNTGNRNYFVCFAGVIAVVNQSMQLCELDVSGCQQLSNVCLEALVYVHKSGLATNTTHVVLCCGGK